MPQLCLFLLLAPATPEKCTERYRKLKNAIEIVLANIF